MTKRYLIIGCLTALTLFSACGKSFLEQTNPNAIPTQDFFESENDVLLAVNGAYQSLRSGDGLGENSGLYTDERSDDAGRNDNQSNAGEPFQFNDFSLLPSNTYLKTHWLGLFQIVSRANLVLTHIDEVTFLNPDNKTRYTAEAKFLRALAYLHLVRKWGDVPLVTKFLGTLDEVAANTFREKQEKVYAQIVADLKDAVNSNLPAQATGDNRGRASKAAANALLGQTYLTMATTLDAANRTANLESARIALTAAWDARTFGTLKEIPYTDVFDVNKKGTCPELIFQIVNKQGDINFSSSIAANNQAKGETINSKKTMSGVGGNVTADLVKEYEEGDPRKDYSIKFANDASVKDYFITKFRDTSSAAGTSGYGGNDWVLIRYADVALMLAEVYMYQGNDAMAIQFLDQVRERAGVPAYATAKADPNYSNKFPTLKLAILHERRVELAFEHHRWFDLLRFFTIEDLATYMHAKNQADFGKAKLSNFGTKDRYYPIPFDEYKLDPVKMYQNPGY